MAGLEPFGIEPDNTENGRGAFGPDAFEAPIYNPKPKESESVLDDDAAIEELRKLSSKVQTIDKNLMKRIEEVKKRKDALETALGPVKKELEHLKSLILQQILSAGASSIKSDTGVNFIRVKKVYYSMESAGERVKFVKAIGREDLLTIPAADFNSLCKSIEAEGKVLPKMVRKVEAYTLTVRGA